MAIVATVGGSTSNSYNTIAEMDTFFALTQWGSVWDAVDSDRQEQLALEAMLTLETQNFLGTKALLEQALQWPRVGGGSQRRVMASGLSQTYGLYDLRDRFWASNVIPTPVKEAQCWFALAANYDFSRQESSAIESAEFWAGSVRIGPDKLGFAAQISSARGRAFQVLSGVVVEVGRVKRLVRC